MTKRRVNYEFAAIIDSTLAIERASKDGYGYDAVERVLLYLCARFIPAHRIEQFAARVRGAVKP